LKLVRSGGEYALLCGVRRERGTLGMRAFIVVAILIFLFASTAQAASQKDWDECAGKDPALSIPACSRIVGDQSEPEQDRADAYMFRAGTYLSQRQSEQAIADYSYAIGLDPRNALAYAGRALAYFHKGDRDHAVLDYRFANRFDPKKVAEFATANLDIAQIAEIARVLAPVPIVDRPVIQNQTADGVDRSNCTKIEGSDHTSHTYCLQMMDKRGSAGWFRID
jgi:tetratricopeptide (TPR) repeat protein